MAKKEVVEEVVEEPEVVDPSVIKIDANIVEQSLKSGEEKGPTQQEIINVRNANKSLAKQMAEEKKKAEAAAKEAEKKRKEAEAEALAKQAKEAAEAAAKKKAEEEALAAQKKKEEEEAAQRKKVEEEAAKRKREEEIKKEQEQKALLEQQRKDKEAEEKARIEAEHKADLLKKQQAAAEESLKKEQEENKKKAEREKRKQDKIAAREKKRQAALAAKEKKRKAKKEKGKKTKPEPKKQEAKTNNTKREKTPVKKDINKSEVQEGPTTTKMVLLGIFFIALIIMVLFLPQIKTFIENRNVKQVETTDGTLSCKKFSATQTLNVDISAKFKFKNKKIANLEYVTSYRGDSNKDEEELVGLYADCKTFESAIGTDIAGITTACSYSGSLVSNTQTFDYNELDKNTITSKFTEAGGVYPNYDKTDSYKKVKDELESSGYQCDVN